MNGEKCTKKIFFLFDFNIYVVDQCKRKWKNLRDSYRAEIKRTERRIKYDKLTGTYSADNNYKTK